MIGKHATIYGRAMVQVASAQGRGYSANRKV
jgi:hypothetical protein